MRRACEIGTQLVHLACMFTIRHVSVQRDALYIPFILARPPDLLWALDAASSSTNHRVSYPFANMSRLAVL